VCAQVDYGGLNGKNPLESGAGGGRVQHHIRPRRQQLEPERVLHMWLRVCVSLCVWVSVQADDGGGGRQDVGSFQLTLGCILVVAQCRRPCRCAYEQRNFCVSECGCGCRCVCVREHEPAPLPVARAVRLLVQPA
jgi:hypothetical protein